MYGVPTIVLTNHEEHIEGSGRSFENFHLFNAIKSCKDLLIKCGGHSVAIGLSMMPDQVHEFRSRFEKLASENTHKSVPLEIDAVITPGDINNVDFHIELMSMEPYGKNNDKPILLLNDVKIIGCELRKNTLNIVVWDKKEDEVAVLSRYLPPDEFILPISSYADIVVSPSFAYFTGNTTIDWKIVDIFPHVTSNVNSDNLTLENINEFQ